MLALNTLFYALAVLGMKMTGTEMEKEVEKEVPTGGDKLAQTSAGLESPSSKVPSVIVRAGKENCDYQFKISH